MLVPDQDTAPCVICKWPAPLPVHGDYAVPTYGLCPIAETEQCIQRAIKGIQPPRPKRPSQAKAGLRQKTPMGHESR